jgi:hypothetical protein
MKRTACIGLWGITILLGFVVGAVIGKASNPEIRPHQPATTTTHREKNREQARLLASLEEFRSTFAEKEQIAANLRGEIEEVRGKVLPPLSPEDEKWLTERQEEDKHTQRWKACWKRSEDLVKKVLQRRDKVLREEGLDELASLLESDKADDKLVGLWSLREFLFERNQFDTERFKPLVVAALDHEDWEVRQYALEHLGQLGYMDYPWRDHPETREAAEVALRMVNDPHPRVKSEALGFLVQFGDRERKEGIANALRSLLQDGSEESVSSALWAIDGLPYDRYKGGIVYENGVWMYVPEKGYDYYEEMKDLVVEASRNPGSAPEVLKFWWQRDTLDKEAVEQAAEMLDGADPNKRLDLPYYSSPASPELREVAYRYYFRVARESLNYHQRSNAVWKLEQTEDRSVIPELKALAASEDAEGIEQQIENAIQRLEKYGKELD